LNYEKSGKATKDLTTGDLRGGRWEKDIRNKVKGNLKMANNAANCPSPSKANNIFWDFPKSKQRGSSAILARRGQRLPPVSDKLSGKKNKIWSGTRHTGCSGRETDGIGRAVKKKMGVRQALNRTLTVLGRKKVKERGGLQTEPSVIKGREPKKKRPSREAGKKRASYSTPTTRALKKG